MHSFQERAIRTLATFPWDPLKMPCSGHQPCSQSSFSHALKKATNRKWGRKRENGYLPFFLKMEKDVPRSLWYLCLKQNKVIWPLLNQVFQGGNCPGVKSWPIPGAEGSSTVSEELKHCRKAYARCQASLGKEGGGTGRQVGGHQALYGAQNLKLPTGGIASFCFLCGNHPPPPKKTVLDEGLPGRSSG